MTRRQRIVARGREEGAGVVAYVAREAKVSREAASLTQRAVAEAVGISPSRYNRIEHGLAPNLTIVQASTILAAVGLRLGARAYPAAQPIRDEAHLALLGRLRACLHPSLGWRTEVPLPIRGDLRAWDANVIGDHWLIGVEAETRPNDAQALRRRIALKQRDGGIEHVILLLADTRHNRELVRAHAADFADDFPLAGRRALELLRAGVDAGGSSIVLP